MSEHERISRKVPKPSVPPLAATSGILQRQCTCGGASPSGGECEDCKKKGETLQRKAENGSARNVAVAPPVVHDVLRSPGEQFPSATRDFFETRMGHDFSNVRIHTDGDAARSADSVNAIAYTVGRHVIFGAGRYDPHTASGRGLIAHELAHVIQQQVSSSSYSTLTISDPGDASEREAALSESVAASTPQPARGLRAWANRPTLHRQCKTGPSCTPPIAGAPGQFAAAEVAEEEPGRTARSAQPPAQIQASGHGRRASNLELLANDNGRDLRVVQGIFVDADMSPNVGGWSKPCKDFVGFVPPYAGPPDGKCIFYPDKLEKEAEFFYLNPSAATVGASVRGLWKAQALQLIDHELGHATFGAASHPGPSGTACTRQTELYRAPSGASYQVNFYLSELNAILSEFPVGFRAASAGDRDVLAYLPRWFEYKVNTAGENIRGILTAMRCKCSCGDVDAFVRDTFLFNTNSWTHRERVWFNAYMATYRDLNWPLAGDLQCGQRCEAAFDRCRNDSGAFDDPGRMNCLAARSSCYTACDRM